MKILQVVQNYYPSIGGTQILFQKLSEKCVQDYGDEVEVFTTDSYYGPDKLMYKKIEPFFEVLQGVKVFRFPFIRMHKKPLLFIQKVSVRLFKKRIPFLNRPLSGPWSPKLNKAIGGTNADVVVASSFGYNYVDYPLWRNKTGNAKPFVLLGAIHFYNDETIQVLTKRVYRSIQLCDTYIANTEYEKQRLVKLSIPAEKIEVLGPPIDMEKFACGNTTDYHNKLNITVDSVIIGYVGRIEPQKNIDLLLTAMPHVWDKAGNVKLVIAGFKTEYVNYLQQQADKISNGEKGKIYFLLDLTEQEKTNLLHTIDILVLPSHSESFGIVFLEAWACKKPVIGVNIGAIACVIKNGADGLLIEKDNPADLAEKIISLSQDKAVRERLGNNGYLKTKKLYSAETLIQRYRTVLAKAITKFNTAKS